MAVASSYLNAPKHTFVPKRPPAAQPEPKPIRYTLDLAQPARMRVTVQVPSLGGDYITFETADRPIHGDRLTYQDVRAVNGRGRPLTFTNTGGYQWTFQSFGEPFTLSYEIRQDGLDAPIKAPWNTTDFIRLRADRVFMAGKGALMVLPDFPEWPRFIQVTGSRFQSATTSWDQTKPVVMRNDRLLMVAGAYRLHTRQWDDKTYTFAMSTDQPADTDRRLIDHFDRVRGAHRQVMGPESIERYLVVSEPAFASSVIEGFAGQNGMVLFRTKSAERRRLSVMAHETFHLWNRRPDGATFSSRWFTEGYTEYYARLALLRSNIITPSQFIEEINMAVRAYTNNPAEGIFDLTSNSRNGNSHQLDYSKGMLVAFFSDMAIRRESRGRNALDEVMRHIRDGRTLDNETISKSYEAVTGRSWQDFFHHTLRSPVRFPILELADKAGVTLTARDGLPQVATDPVTLKAITALRTPR